MLVVKFMPDPRFNSYILPDPRLKPEDLDMEILMHCKMIFDAYIQKKPKVDSRACCPLAERRDCVCLISFYCPIHGVKCIGSHE